MCSEDNFSGGTSSLTIVVLQAGIRVLERQNIGAVVAQEMSSHSLAISMVNKSIGQEDHGNGGLGPLGLYDIWRASGSLPKFE